MHIFLVIAIQDLKAYIYHGPAGPPASCISDYQMTCLSVHTALEYLWHLWPMWVSLHRESKICCCPWFHPANKNNCTSTHPPVHPLQRCLQPHQTTHQLIHILPYNLIPTNGLRGLHDAGFVMTKHQTILLKIVHMNVVRIQAGLVIGSNVWHVDYS